MQPTKPMLPTPPLPKPRARSWRQRLGRGIVFAAIFAAGGELAVRLGELVLDRTSTDPTTAFPVRARSRASRRTLAPDRSVRFAERDGDVVYRANRLGYRGPAPDSGERRVALLGDSIAFGLGVQEEETLGSLLQRGFDAGSPPSARVSSFAIPGYDLIDTTEAFEQDAIPWSPTDTILQVTHNDFGERNRQLASSFSKTGWIHSLAGGRRLRQLWGHWRGGLPGDPPRWPDPRAVAEAEHWRRRVESGTDDAAVALRRISALLEMAGRGGARTVLVWTPLEAEARDGRPDSIAARLRETAEGAGAEFVDATEVLHPRTGPSRTRDGVHPTAEGYSALARAIQPALPSTPRP
jgi:lysophospholipase L1-like esterase